MAAPARAAGTSQRKHESFGLIRKALRIGFTPTPRNVLHWASWAVTLAILLAMTAVLMNGRIYGWEIDFARWAQKVDFPDWLFTLTGDNLTNSDAPQGVVIISGVIIVLWVLRLRIEASLVALSVPLHILANFPKALVERERPSGVIDGLAGVGGDKSFPSGHAEFAITFYGYLIYVAFHYVHNRVIRALMLGLWLGVAASVGFGRISVGRHWPLDSIAGYIAGVGVLSGLIWLHRSLYAAQAARDQ